MCRTLLQSEAIVNNANFRNHLTTNEMAESLLTTSKAIRKRLCVTGSYYGINPVKLPSGRLLWPANAVRALIGQAA